MTKREFLLSVPDIITHKTWGYGELEVITESKETKGVCYRHQDKTTSCGSYAPTWKELYDTFSKQLIDDGYMMNNKLYE